MEETSSGHLVINLGKDIENDKDEVVKKLYFIKEQKDYNMKDLKKIHRAFGHPTHEKLKRLMIDAGISDPKIAKTLKMIQENCRICKKFRKRETRPKTALPKARSINEVISMDLKPVASLTENPNDKRHILYIMDEFSRLIKGTIVKSKEPKEIAEKVLEEFFMEVRYCARNCTRFFVKNTRTK